MYFPKNGIRLGFVKTSEFQEEFDPPPRYANALVPARDQTSIPWSSSLYPSHYTNYCILAHLWVLIISKNYTFQAGIHFISIKYMKQFILMYCRQSTIQCDLWTVYAAHIYSKEDGYVKHNLPVYTKCPLMLCYHVQFSTVWFSKQSHSYICEEVNTWHAY
jgi:hypothetical protein